MTSRDGGPAGSCAGGHAGKIEFLRAQGARKARKGGLPVMAGLLGVHQSRLWRSDPVVWAAGAGAALGRSATAARVVPRLRRCSCKPVAGPTHTHMLQWIMSSRMRPCAVCMGASGLSSWEGRRSSRRRRECGQSGPSAHMFGGTAPRQGIVRVQCATEACYKTVRHSVMLQAGRITGGQRQPLLGSALQARAGPRRRRRAGRPSFGPSRLVSASRCLDPLSKLEQALVAAGGANEGEAHGQATDARERHADLDRLCVVRVLCVRFQ